jgi:hypothetical protein
MKKWKNNPRRRLHIFYHQVHATGAVFRTWIDIQGRLDPKLGLSNPNTVQAKQSVKREF